MKTSTKATIVILLFLTSIITALLSAPKGNDMIQWDRDMEKVKHYQKTGEKADNSHIYKINQ